MMMKMMMMIKKNGVTMPPNYFGGEIGKMSMPTNYC